MEQIWLLEIGIIQALQHLGSWLIVPMQAISSLGSEGFFIVLLPVILWCVDYSLGLRVGFILVTSGQVFLTLKMVFHSPRPFWYSEAVRAYSMETSFGMPSGHAMNAMMIFGQIAAGLRKKWVSWLCAILILLVGFSRVYLGMHFISDVLAGWLIGGAILAFSVREAARIGAWVSRKPLSAQYLVVIGSAVAWPVIASLPLWLGGNWVLPQIWVDHALRYGTAAMPDPYNLSGIYTYTGIWLGIGLGSVWLHARGGYDARGDARQQLERVVIGLTGTLILWAGLDAIFPGGQNAFALALRVARYALVGWWVSAGAPALFIRKKLAQGKNADL